MSGTGEMVRVRTLADYVGQEKLKERLLVHIEAARKSNRNLDHILIEGHAGYGKTTLAEAIARELNEPFVSYNMPMKELELLYFIEEWDGGIIFLDELHAASVQFQEMLQPGLEQGFMQFGGVTVETTHITFIGATTQGDKIIEPLRDRFTIKPVFEEYSDDEMSRIVEGMAKRAGVDLPEGVAAGLSRAAGGTPRVAGSLVAAMRSLTALDHELTAEAVLDLAGVDVDGLSERHLHYLRTLKELGRTAGLDSLSRMMHLHPKDLEKLEPLLIKRGFIETLSKGRTITSAGLAKLPRPVRADSAERRQRSMT